MTQSPLGVLLVNLGTPQMPNKRSVFRYLQQFLSDPRVVDRQDATWRIVLNTVILPLRVALTTRNYQKIWRDEGSPLWAISSKQESKLSALLGDAYEVKLAMTYGSPNIASKLDEFIAQGIDRIIVLPLYPQYSSTTTAAVFDSFADALKKYRSQIDFRFIWDYHRKEDYIKAIAQSIELDDDEHIIFSYHSLPVRYVHSGDPYQKQCEQTTQLIIEQLQLSTEQYSLCYQSHFGREPWLEPFTDTHLVELTKRGIKKVAVVCPGFSSDCIETLEEIDIRNRRLFYAQGGESYRFIPCLNESDQHIELLASLIKKMEG